MSLSTFCVQTDVACERVCANVFEFFPVIFSPFPKPLLLNNSSRRHCLERQRTIPRHRTVSTGHRCQRFALTCLPAEILAKSLHGNCFCEPSIYDSEIHSHCFPPSCPRLQARAQRLPTQSRTADNYFSVDQLFMTLKYTHAETPCTIS
jgi:hypothetical protein